MAEYIDSARRSSGMPALILNPCACVHSGALCALLISLIAQKRLKVRGLRLECLLISIELQALCSHSQLCESV